MMILSMKTNTGINYYENCTFEEFNEYVIVFNKICEKNNK